MSDQSQPTQGSLSEADRETIRAACAEVGFPLCDIEVDGDLLRLLPESLSELPDATVLGTLVDRLEKLEYRYVTFMIPESDQGETSR